MPSTKTCSVILTVLLFFVLYLMNSLVTYFKLWLQNKIFKLVALSGDGSDQKFCSIMAAASSSIDKLLVQWFEIWMSTYFEYNICFTFACIYLSLNGGVIFMQRKKMRIFSLRVDKQLRPACACEFVCEKCMLKAFHADAIKWDCKKSLCAFLIIAFLYGHCVLLAMCQCCCTLGQTSLEAWLGMQCLPLGLPCTGCC